MTSVIILKDNGDTLLGADEEGNLYDGTRTQVGYDELTITTVLAQDGESFERVTSYGDTIISRGVTTREGMLSGRGMENSPEEDQDAAWDDEIELASNLPVMETAYVDGVRTTVPMTIPIIEWTAREI